MQPSFEENGFASPIDHPTPMHPHHIHPNTNSSSHHSNQQLDHPPPTNPEKQNSISIMQNGGGGVVAGSPPGSSQLGTSFDSAMGPSAGSSLNGGNGNPGGALGTNGGPNHSAYNNPKNRFLSGDINNREAYIRRQLISIGKLQSSEKNSIIRQT